MKFSVISFTEKGEELSCRLTKTCQEFSVEQYRKRKQNTEPACSAAGNYVKEPLTDWVRTQFAKKNAVLFIGACQIAVRAIAPVIQDKLTDPPVLVMDEQGTYVIPILSGHIGGANALARELAERMGAVPVITTATDLNRKFAVDVFAKKNALWIQNREGIAQVSAKILREEEITISVGEEHYRKAAFVPELVRLVPFPPDGDVDVLIAEEPGTCAAKLVLTPKNYVLGVGCKKGTTEKALLAFVTEQLKRLGICFSQIGAVASVDRKSEEAGLQQFTLDAGIPFLTYSAEELACVEGTFHESEFVQETIGIGNVCERAALRACAKAGEGMRKEAAPDGMAVQSGALVLEKTAKDGMTLAVAKREWEVHFDGCQDIYCWDRTGERRDDDA